MSEPTRAFRCNSCGRWHDELPMDLGCAYPDYYFGVPEDERASRIWCDRADNPNFCVIDKTDRFIRGCLHIPVIDAADHFVFGLWTSLSEKSFNRAFTIWHEDPPSDEPAYFGWLSNRLKMFPDTMNLKTKVRLQQGNERPRIELQPTDHPLAIAQREGITMQRVQEIVEAVMHDE